MIKYVTEAENIEMNVQLGPQEEINAEAEECKCDPGAEAACAAKNPVEEAKKNPDTVPVAGITKEGVKEFYVDAKDVEKYAELTEQTMLEALNDIIACNEEAGMEASNMVIVMSEGTEGYIHNLEKHGAACVSFVNEAEDVTMDVQVGPEGEEIVAKEDPQEANPVDAVKRQYDTVVVAKDDDKFFMDVEDVQKCADINCESVIETLNGIIAANEAYDMNTENVVVMIGENYCDLDVLCALEEAEVACVYEAGATVKDLMGIENFVRGMNEICKTIGGRLAGNKTIKSSAIKESISRIDKQIERMEEEYEMSKEKGFAPKLKWAVKMLISSAPSLILSYAVSAASIAATGAALSAFGGDAALKKLIAATVGGSIAGTAGVTVISAGLYRREVESLLHVLKAQKAILESRLKAAEDRESEGKNTLLV